MEQDTQSHPSGPTLPLRADPPVAGPPFLNRLDGQGAADAAMQALLATFPSLAEDVMNFASALPTEEECEADDDVRLIADNQILLVLLAATAKALLATVAERELEHAGK